MNENVITQKRLQCEMKKKLGKSKSRKEGIDEGLLTTNQQFVIRVVGNVFLVVLEKVANSKVAILAIKEGKK